MTASARQLTPIFLYIWIIILFDQQGAGQPVEKLGTGYQAAARLVVNHNCQLSQLSCLANQIDSTATIASVLL
jgi:hypothetical protein